MSNKCHIIVLLMGLGLILSTASATVGLPNEGKAHIEYNGEFPSPDEFIPVDSMPEMIYESVPEYPRLARAAGMEATVWIKSLINKKGEVVKALVFKSSGTKVGFDEAALEAAYKCKFTPALQKGQPVAVWIAYAVSFVLTKDETKEKEKDQNKEK